MSKDFHLMVVTGLMIGWSLVWLATAEAAGSGAFQGPAGQVGLPGDAADRISAAKSEFEEHRDFTTLTGSLQAISERCRGQVVSQIQVLDTIVDIGKAYRGSLPPKGKGLVRLSTQIARELAGQADANGVGNVETSCQVANLLELLAHQFRNTDREQAADLYRHVGQIGRRLASNPRVPTAARSGLATYLVAEAKGYLLLGDNQKTIQIISEALSWGLVEFDKIEDEDLFQRATCSTEIFEAIDNSRQKYRERIEPGIRSEIAGFARYDFDFSLPDVTDRQLTRSNFADAELLVIDVWGSWCAPCRASIPHLNELGETYRDRGLRIVGIAMEQGDTLEEKKAALKNFLEQHEVNYSCLIGDETVTQRIPNFRTFPTLLFVDRNGQVRFSTSGYVDDTQLAVIADSLLPADKSSTHTSVPLQSRQGN